VFAGLELERLTALMPAGGDATGTLGGSADVDWASPGLSNLGVAFELNAGGLTAAGRDLGPASVSGRLTEGLLVSSGSCCGASLNAVGQVADEGLRELDASLSAEDLATLGSVFGLDGLEGSATAEVAVVDTGASPSLAASVDVPDLRFRDVQAGPLHLEASGKDGVYGLLYEAFDSTLLGTASLESDRTYSTSVTASSFDLTAVLPDSLREAMSLAGLVSGVASASGGLGDTWFVTGEISELDLAVRRQRATLTAPFSFSATPDSVSLTEASLAGTFGELSLAGSYTTSDVLDVALTFDGAELAEIVDLLPRPPAVTPHGQVRGSVTLAGTRESPVFAADVYLRAFEMYGLSLESATLEATGDSSDVVLYLSAAGAESGNVWISGGLPVRPDSLTLLALDEGREFGVSVASSGFVLDAREPILPGIRGQKRFRFDGSALLTGTADSLATVAGSGLLSELSASFDLAEFSLVDTVYFEVEHGSVVFDDLVVDVVRRHVLGEPYGGRLEAGGHVSLDGETRIRAATSDLDIGHLARALGGRTGAQLKGTLDGEALVEGTAGEKRVSFSWKVRFPRLFDLGFDTGEGSGSFESGVLTLDRADLTAGGGTIGLSGRVTTGARRAGGLAPGTTAGTVGESESPELDLRLATDGFRLKRLVELPPAIDSIDGRLDVDLSVRGSAREPVIDGTALLADGRLEVLGLKEPLTDIELDVQAGGTTVAVRRAQLRSGGGRVE
ncbi:MAG TPA: hypothetical protein VE960_04590, partial [bacterium]|nr:hypothetical protein [bacterium]